MSGLDDTFRSIKANRRTPTEQITRGALGIKGMMDLLLLRDFQNKFAIDAAEQKAAAKDRQPGMEDVEIMTTDDEMRIGDEYHIHYGSQSQPAQAKPQAAPQSPLEPVAPQTVPQPAQQPPTTNKPKGVLATAGTMLAGAALLGSGFALSQAPSLLTPPHADPPAAVAPVEPGTDNDTLMDFSISGGVEGGAGEYDGE